MASTDPDYQEKLTLREIPEDTIGYDAWRHSVCASILGSARDPVAAMQYITEIELLSMNDLAMILPTALTKLDVRLYAAITAAAVRLPEMSAKLRAGARLGCGRQAMRILDTNFRFESTTVAIRASKQIQALTCSTMDDLDPFLANFGLYKEQMGTAEH